MSTTLNAFLSVSLEDITKLFPAIKPSSGPFDTLPPFLLSDVFNLIGHTVVSMINLSLSTRYVPSQFKHAIVQRLLDKPNLYSPLPKYYRLNSKLPYNYCSY